ncbi:hypothetical protein ACPCHT_28220 [Nucisporomicrobium flavum]|uniref:hypothetical protein n=1 Tax=Nucisporomicrobium flavum TaxID=2785915 RepID=UPI003C2FC865
MAQPTMEIHRWYRLSQRFEEVIGVTPKRLARTYRFAATVFAIGPAGPIDWGDLAGGAGYFDQAHFGHEFRALQERQLTARYFGATGKAEESPVGKVVMYGSVSVDGFVADEND